MRYIVLMILSLSLLTACTTAAATLTPTQLPTPTPTAMPTPTPTSEWEIAFAVLSPKIVEAEGSVEGNLPSSLYLVRENGNGLMQLTDEIEYITNLTASPDGRYLLFSATREDTTGDRSLGRGDLAHLYFVDVQSREIFTLTSGIEFTEWQGGSWSPDGERIAFAAQEANVRSEFDIEGFRYRLCLINRDGTGKRCLVEQDGIIWTVDWSPTGEQILFEQGGAIWLVRPDGSGLFKVADAPIEDGRPYSAQPVWSPDGQRIAFAAPGVGGENNADIFVVNADGSDLLNLTEHPAEDIQPTWSPDGQYIAFRRGGLGIWAIYVMKTDGGTCREVFHNVEWSARHPIWSPDGSKIALVGSKAWDEHLFITNLTGNTRLLSEHIADRPAWVLMPTR